MTATEDVRAERRRIRWFFAGLLIVNGVLNVVDALLVQHQTRSQVLETFLPTSITLGVGRTGVVVAGLALLLLAGGVARGKRVAWQLTCLVLIASIALDLVKDLDIEDATLAGWILLGLWWMRHHFAADTDPRSVRWGFWSLGAGIALAITYAVAGSIILENQLSPGITFLDSLTDIVAAMAGSPSTYRALTDRAQWFLGSVPIVSYFLVFFALTQMLRPVLAPRATEAERQKVRDVLAKYGSNRISHLAIHGTASYFWLGDEGCVAFTLVGRIALVLGDPIGPPQSLQTYVARFVEYCEQQDWIPAFYQVEQLPYRDMGLTLVPIGAEAVISTGSFTLTGKERANLRQHLHRCERAGVRVAFMPGPRAWAQHAEQMREVSGAWLDTRRSPELGFSLGTLNTVLDPEITAALAIAASGRLEGFVTWLPVPLRKAWTLDLMRRRPDSITGVMEALIGRSIQEAAKRGVAELSLGVAPRAINAEGGHVVGRAERAMYWGLDRFQRSRTLQRFKAKFGPRWEDSFLAVTGSAVLPEVLVALVRAHLPTAAGSVYRVRAALGGLLRGRVQRRPEVA
jgi:phosphatidylglycerol lysyltransferase